MIKKIAGLVLAVAAWSGLGTFEARAQQRMNIVFVNMESVFTNFYKTKSADAQLKQQAEAFNQERQKMVAELKDLQEQFDKIREEAQNVALNEDVRLQKRNQAEEKLMAIRDQESKVRRFDELRGKQLEEQTRRVRNGILQEIRDTIERMARERNYDVVIDSSGKSLNGVEMFLYVDAKNDVTAEVVRTLNATGVK